MGDVAVQTAVPVARVHGAFVRDGSPCGGAGLEARGRPQYVDGTTSDSSESEVAVAVLTAVKN